MMNFGENGPFLAIFCEFLDNPPMFMENLQKKGHLFREFWTQKPTHMGGTYPYPQHVMLPPPPGLNSMNIARENLQSVHISVLYAQGLLDGGTKPFLLNDDGVRDTFSMFKMGDEVFSNFVKLSSAPAPRNKNDRSLNLHDFQKKWFF